MKRKFGFWIILWLLLVVVTGVLAFGSGYGSRGYGPWHGWSHMGGWQYGYQSEVAPGWYGMAPGIMGDVESGYGWGGMGRFHCTPGHGMSGGAYGMMSWLPQNMTEEQEKKARQLLDDTEKANNKLMQQRLDAQAKLYRLYTSEKRDWNAIRAVANELSDLKSQQLKSAIDVQQKIALFIRAKPICSAANIGG